MVMSGDAFKGGTVVFTFVVDDKGMKESLKKVGANINAVHEENTRANRQAVLDQKKDFNAQQKLANQALNEQLRGDKARRSDFTHKLDQENKRMVSAQRTSIQTEKVLQTQTANRIKHEAELARHATFDQRKRFNDKQRLASQALNEQMRTDKARRADLTDKLAQEDKRQISAQRKRLEIERAQQTKELNRRNYTSQIAGLQAKEEQRKNTQRLERERIVQARMRTSAQREQLINTRARNAQKAAAAAQQANAKTMQTLEGVGKAAGVAGAALTAFAGIGILAAQKQEIAERRLGAALEANYINRDKWFDRFKDQADELSRISNFANQDILNLQDTLVRQTKSAEIAYQLTPGILDVSAMRDQDWRELAAQMSRAAKGQTLTIESASLQLPDHLLDMSVQDRAKEIAKILDKDYGGSMESARKAQVSFYHSTQDTLELMGSGMFTAIEFTLTKVQKIVVAFNEWSRENKWLAQTIGWVVAAVGAFLVIGGGGLWITIKLIQLTKDAWEAYKLLGSGIRRAVLWLRFESKAKITATAVAWRHNIALKAQAFWQWAANRAIVANTWLMTKNIAKKLILIALTIILAIKNFALAVSFGVAAVAAAVFWTVATLGIALVVLAVISLITWVARLVKKWGGFGAAMKKIWNFVVNIVKKHWDLILAVLFPVIGLPILIWRNWSKIIDFVKEIFGTVLRIIGSVVEALTFGTVGQGITDLGDRLRGDLPKRVSVGVTPVLAEGDEQSWLDKIIAAAATPIVWAWNLAGDFKDEVIKWWNGVAFPLVINPLNSNLGGAAGRTIAWVWNLIGNFATTAASWLADAAKTIQDGVGTVLAWTWNLAGDFVTKVTTAIIDFAKWLQGKATETIAWAWNLAGDFVTKVTSAVIDFAKWIWDKATKTFGWIWNIAGDFVTKVTDAVIDFAQWIWDKATKTFSWVWDIAGTVFSKVTDAIIGFASAVIDGAKDTIGWVWDLAGNFVTKAKEWFDAHGNKLIKYATDGISWIVGLVAGNVALAVSTWIGWISTGISWAVTLAKGASKAVATWLGYAKDGIGWIVNLVKGTVGSTVQGWITNITNGIKWIVQLVKGTAQSTVDVLKDWVSNTINWVVNLSGTISKAVSDFLAAGAAAFGALVSGTKSLILNLTGTITANIKSFIDNIGTTWNAITAGTKSLILSVTGTVASAVEDFLEDSAAAWDDLVDGTKRLVLSVTGSIDNAVKSFVEGIGKTWDQLSDDTVNLILNLSGTISNAVSAFITAHADAWNALKSDTKSLVLNVSGTIVTAVSSFLSGIGANWATITGGTKDFVVNLSGTLSKNVVDFVTANKTWINAITDVAASWTLSIAASFTGFAPVAGLATATKTLWNKIASGLSVDFPIIGKIIGIEEDLPEADPNNPDPAKDWQKGFWDGFKTTFTAYPALQGAFNIVLNIGEFLLAPSDDISYNFVVNDATLESVKENTNDTNKWLQNIFAALTQSAFRTSNDGSPNLVGAGTFTMSGLAGGSKTLRQYMSGSDGAWTEALITKQYREINLVRGNLVSTNQLLRDIRQWLSLIWLNGRTDAIVDFYGTNRANTLTTMTRGGATSDWAFQYRHPQISDYGKPRSGGGGGGLDKTQEDQLSAAATGAKAAADAVGDSTSGLPKIKSAIDAVKTVVDAILAKPGGGGALDTDQAGWLKRIYDEVTKTEIADQERPHGTQGSSTLVTIAGSISNIGKELDIVKDKVNGKDNFIGGLYAIRTAIDGADGNGGLKKLITDLEVTSGGFTTADRRKLGTAADVKGQVQRKDVGLWAIRNAVDGVNGSGGVKAVVDDIKTVVRHTDYGLKAIKNALSTSSNNGNSDASTGDYATADHRHDSRYARYVHYHSNYRSDINDNKDTIDDHIENHPTSSSSPSTGHHHNSLYPTKADLKTVKDLAQLARNGDIANAAAINTHINNHPGPAVTGSHNHAEYSKDTHSHGADEHNHPLYSVTGHSHGSNPANPSQPQTTGSFTADDRKWLDRIHDEVAASYSTSAANRTIVSVRGMLEKSTYGLEAVYDDFFNDSTHGFAALLAAIGSNPNPSPSQPATGHNHDERYGLKGSVATLSAFAVSHVTGHVKQKEIDDEIDDLEDEIDDLEDEIEDHKHDDRYGLKSSIATLSSFAVDHVKGHVKKSDISGDVSGLASDVASALGSARRVLSTLVLRSLSGSDRTLASSRLGNMQDRIDDISSDYARGISGTSLNIQTSAPDLTAAVWFHSISNAIEKVRLITKEIQKYLVRKLGAVSKVGDFALNYFRTAITTSISLPSTIRHIVSGDAGNTELDTTGALAVASAGAYGTAGAVSPYGAGAGTPNISLTINGNVYGVDDLEDAVMRAIRKAKQRGTTMV